MTDSTFKNKKIKEELSLAVEKGHFIHAYIFCGGSGKDRTDFGRWFANTLLCDSETGKPCGKCKSCLKIKKGCHEDFISVSPADGRKSISAAQIEELESKLHFKPFSDRYVVLIEDAASMRADAQNKLLKTLEEPMSSAVIILLAERAEMLLDTIRSRCIAYFLEESSASSEEKYISAAEQMKMLILQDSSYYKKRIVIDSLSSEKTMSRDEALSFVDCFEQLARETLQGCDDEISNKIINAVYCAEELRRCIQNQHNINYTMRQFCLKI